MFTDGYPDQFGGPKSKKFKYNSFRKILLANQVQSLQKQKEILEDTITHWQSFIDPITGKEHEQIDDIVIVGIKI